MMMNRPQTHEPLPRVAFVATGGTIAGKLLESETPSGRYQSAQETGENLVLGIPGLLHRAKWQFEQPYSIGSQDLQLHHMLHLRAVLVRLLQSSDVDGILVTHGTDTMEDMLYFLYLTLPSDILVKPLLFTGAMLPSDHAEADGPGNISASLDFLLQSLQASHVQMPFGLVMQGLFTPAQCVEKQSTAGLDAFDGPSSVTADSTWRQGFDALDLPSGSAMQGEFAGLFEENPVRHPLFEAMEVPVVYCAPGNAPVHQLNDLLNRKPASVVVAAPGHGNIPEACVPALRRLLVGGVSVVRASKVPTGGVVQGGEFDALDDFREPVDGSHAGLFTEAGDLSLGKCVMLERLRVLARSLSI
ncbi:MAG TPA: asparaginase domain-containing protein [Limnobacter sp.]|nr:asparaginase domain-containing protein [Limnobacter sp.]